MSIAFPKLFAPGNIGKMEVKNRLIKAPTCTYFADKDGYVTERLIRLYKEWAMGNVGIVIVEFSWIDKKASRTNLYQLSVSGDEYLPGLSRLAAAIQENGAKAALQIVHAGRQVRDTTLPVMAPSRIPWNVMYAKGAPAPGELTFEEIEEIADAFGDAALRAKKAGFDMVEVHGGHGYLITGMLSPITNRRTDWYGGSLKNRMRFLIDVVINIRKKVGADYPLSIRLSGSDYQEGGITIEETKEVAKALEKNGVNLIHISGGIHETIRFEVAPMFQPQALHAHLAKAIKKVVNIPVVASGSITTPHVAEHILQKGWADFISLGRPIWADPYFAHKAEEGRPEDIAPCIRCNEGCLLRRSLGEDASCAVNVMFGHEGELSIERAVKGKKIGVIGGGPGGMESARVAALRGHQVTIYDNRDRLGGRLSQTSELIPDLANLVDYQTRQIEKLGVKVILGKEVSVQEIQQQGFDAVILATGAKQSLDDIKGIKGINKNSVMTVDDVMKGKKIGQNVVIVGDGLISYELALFLGAAGKLYGLSWYRRLLPQEWVKRVTKWLLIEAKLPSSLRRTVRIIETPEDTALRIESGIKQVIFAVFDKYGVEVNTGLTLEEVVRGGVIAVDKNGKKYNFKADSIVYTNFVARNSLFGELKNAKINVYAVGDCVEPRKIYDAIHEGYKTALNL